MMNYKYRDNDEWKMSNWPWTTLDSMNNGIVSGDVKPNKKVMSWNDVVIMRSQIANLVTGVNLSRRAKYNAKASEAALNNGTKCIKDLFTAGCPGCGTKGEKIPREKEEFKNCLPGLFCPKCQKPFISRSIYNNKPVFAIAAGPSLSNNGTELKRVVGKYPIFAVDTALPALKLLEVKPDYMMTVEVDPLINEMEIDSEDVAMIATITVDPKFRKSWKGPVYFLDTPTFNAREKKKRGKARENIGWASPGGNVSSVLFSMLYGTFPSKIIMVGHDFSYPHLMEYYAKGGPMSMIPGKMTFSTHDIYGQKVLTDNSLFGYKEWTQMAIKSLTENPWAKVVNATEGGILGTTYYDPEKLIRIKRYTRELIYRFDILVKEKRWPSREEAQENGFQGPNLDCIEYLTLKEAIDKYCPLAVKE